MSENQNEAKIERKEIHEILFNKKNKQLTLADILRMTIYLKEINEGRMLPVQQEEFSAPHPDDESFDKDVDGIQDQVYNPDDTDNDDPDYYDDYHPFYDDYHCYTDAELAGMGNEYYDPTFLLEADYYEDDHLYDYEDDIDTDNDDPYAEEEDEKEDYWYNLEESLKKGKNVKCQIR